MPQNTKSINGNGERSYSSYVAEGRIGETFELPRASINLHEHSFVSITHSTQLTHM